MIPNFSIPQNHLQENSCLSAAVSLGGVVRISADQNTGEVTEEAPRGEGEADRAGLLVLNTGIVSANPEKGTKTVDKGHFERISRRFELQQVSRELLPGERVCKCLRWRFNASLGVGVQYVQAVKRAHYSNLITCGLSWVCPVCAAKISERRRVELSKGTDFWNASGGSMFLATFTMRHNSGDKLADLLRDMSGAYRKMRAGRFWERFEKQFRIVGSVAAHEITYGQDSGFHPHKHVLFFVRGAITNLEKFEIWFILTHRWQAKLSGFGRDASDLVGVDIQVGYGDISEYVTKWGLVEEVTKTPSKAGCINGKAKHFSPFQLLDLVKQGSSWAGPVFQAYASATKGKNQLTWSPGLRDLFGLGEDLTDLEVAEKQEENAVLLITLLWPEWRQVLKNNARAMLLEVACMGNADLVYAYLRGLGICLEGDK